MEMCIISMVTTVNTMRLHNQKSVFGSEIDRLQLNVFQNTFSKAFELIFGNKIVSDEWKEEYFAIYFMSRQQS